MNLSARSYLPLLAALIVFVLSVDAVAAQWVQWPLAVLVWGFLLLVAAPLAPVHRAAICVVVLLAVGGELLVSEVWHRYEYRFGVLPPYVPAGHALVYLAGLKLAEWEWARRRERALRIVATLALVGWAVLGVVALRDISALPDALLLAVMLLVAPRGLMYCGIFAAVALLEIYGTMAGVWTWADVVPGTSITGGNPPSGAAATYVLCDVVAIAIAPHALRAWRALTAGGRQDAGAVGATDHEPQPA